jgi:hypothetical protein
VRSEGYFTSEKKEVIEKYFPKLLNQQGNAYFLSQHSRRLKAGGSLV